MTTTPYDRTADPIARIVWLPAAELAANDYNPNMVLDPELVLLERSILRTGWVQPILVRPPSAKGEPYVIIDGFHRVRLSVGSTALRERYAGLVPCSVLSVSKAESMMLTVRINAAKGSHRAVRMADLVRALIDVEGVPVETIARDCGMLKEEVDRLYQDDVFKARDIATYRYSGAWEPARETEEQVLHRRATGEASPESLRPVPVRGVRKDVFKPMGRPKPKKPAKK